MAARLPGERRGGSDSEALAAAATPTVQHRAATGSLHALTEAVLVFAAATTRLVSTLHRIVNLGSCGRGDPAVSRIEAKESNSFPKNCQFH